MKDKDLITIRISCLFKQFLTLPPAEQNVHTSFSVQMKIVFSCSSPVEACSFMHVEKNIHSVPFPNFDRGGKWQCQDSAMGLLLVFS